MINKICFVAPETPYLSEISLPPLNLLYLESYINQKFPNIETEIIDLNYINARDIYGKLSETDIFIITATTPQFPYAIDFVKCLNKNNLKAKTIIGGCHVTAFGLNQPYDVCKTFDKIILGDGEIVLERLIKNSERNKEQKVYKGIPVDNLDNIPFPNYAKSKDKYRYYIDRKLSTIVLTSRGCPYSCHFCFCQQQVRYHTINYVNRELKEIRDIGYDGVYFVDDIFLLRSDPDLLKLEILKKFAWKCQIRPDTPLKKVDILSKLGCKEVSIGIESGSQKILNIVNKKVNLRNEKGDNKIYELVKTLKKTGIKVRAYIIVGLPSESHETINETIELLEHIEADSVGVGTFVPYPGTYIYNNIDKFDIKIEEADYTKWFFRASAGSYQCIVSTSNLSSQEILRYRDIIDKDFNYHNHER